jgi:cysteine desulfurase
VSSYYLDSNSKSPLSDSVKGYLLKGDFDFGNPGSIHRSGRTARAVVDRAVNTINAIFNSSHTHQLFFHSGATEGINTFVSGVAREASMGGKKVAYFYSTVDHPVSIALATKLKEDHHITYQFTVDCSGSFDHQALIKKIMAVRSQVSQVILNYQVVNSITGVVWPLSVAAKIKSESGCVVSVDYTQAPGKIEQWDGIDLTLDAYHLSGHKFGALPGVGFSLVCTNSKFSPLIVGGGQQQGLRAGSENVLGIHSIVLALQDLAKRASYQNLLLCRQELEGDIQRVLGERGKIIALSNPLRAVNTIYFMIEGVKSQELVVALDLAGIEVSAGTACSAGIANDHYILEAMGFSGHEKLGGVRISLPPSITYDQLQVVRSTLSSVLERFLA